MFVIFLPSTIKYRMRRAAHLLHRRITLWRLPRCTRLLTARPLPDPVTIAPAQLVATEYIARDSVKLWDWPIFPEGFHSAHLMELARLQAWTLKPAILMSQPASASASYP
jgi:hypothetical protein